MTELYGTLGPACYETEILKQLFNEGMTGVRLNLSHTTLVQSRNWIENLHEAAESCGLKSKLIIDMQGPELRIGKLNTPLELISGKEFTLGLCGSCIPVQNDILKEIEKGQQILLDDGKILAKAVEVHGDYIICKVERGGELKSGKSLALPGVKLNLPVMTSADIKNIKQAKEFGVTGIMQPFVRSAEDLKQVRQALIEAGAGELKIYAKIENSEGVTRINEFLPEADEIVIARGDLGNSMPLWHLPKIQKYIGEVCKEHKKPFMVVTQLLHSMENSAVPTRAEVSDIFNAILDGASSLMVTGETAVGKYPVQVMEYLSKTAKEAELYVKKSSEFHF